MLLGFSLAPMLPMLANGLKARDALFPGVEDWIAESFADHNPRSPYGRLKPGDRLDLWWKPRTAQRRKLGEVPCRSLRRIHLGHMPGDDTAWAMSCTLETGTATGIFKSLTCDEIWTDVLQPDGFALMRDGRAFFCLKPGIFVGIVVGW
jgi:hypothetical protein